MMIESKAKSPLAPESRLLIWTGLRPLYHTRCLSSPIEVPPIKMKLAKITHTRTKPNLTFFLSDAVRFVGSREVGLVNFETQLPSYPGPGMSRMDPVTQHRYTQ